MNKTSLIKTPACIVALCLAVLLSFTLFLLPNVADAGGSGGGGSSSGRSSGGGGSSSYSNRAAQTGDRGTISRSGNFNNYNNGRSYTTVSSQRAANSLGSTIRSATGGRVRTFALRDTSTGRIVGYTAVTTPWPTRRSNNNNSNNGNNNNNNGNVFNVPSNGANLTVGNLAVGNTSNFDNTTGIYGSVTIAGRVTNRGTGQAGPSRYSLRLANQSNSNAYAMSALARNRSASASATFSNVSFGPLSISLEADVLNQVAETNESDNALTNTVTLAPPTPNMTLTTPQEVVGSGGDAVISWDTDATYSMNCTLSGPGITSITFDPSVSGATGNVTATGLTSAGTFQLQCVEPITSSVFTETLDIEVVGEVQEI